MLSGHAFASTFYECCNCVKRRHGVHTINVGRNQSSLSFGMWKEWGPGGCALRPRRIRWSLGDTVPVQSLTFLCCVLLVWLTLPPGWCTGACLNTALKWLCQELSEGSHVWQLVEKDPDNILWTSDLCKTNFPKLCCVWNWLKRLLQHWVCYMYICVYVCAFPSVGLVWV